MRACGGFERRGDSGERDWDLGGGGLGCIHRGVGSSQFLGLFNKIKIRLSFGFTSTLETKPDPIWLKPDQPGRVGSVFEAGRVYRIKISALVIIINNLSLYNP